MTFDRYLALWQLVPDGQSFRTPTSQLVPVRRNGRPAMLKIAHEPEERGGAALMVWWAGDGAARVLEHEDDALLLERAQSSRSLAWMARNGQDDEASRILCQVAARLHTPRGRPPPGLIPLEQWFVDLYPAAERYGGILRQAAAQARDLLAEPQEVGVLHGDLHHDNVLDFGSRGWLAIDPKRLVGERGFDFANILRDPDIEVATTPGRLARQVQVIAEAASLDRERLLRWVLAFAGLSAAWILGDGDEPALDLAVADLAATELGDG